MRVISTILLDFRRFAGHSKWSNIKHIKAKKDAERSVTFMRLCRQMAVAIAENGGIHDPAANLRLSQTIEVAKKANMPNATIQNFLNNHIKKSLSAKKHIYGLKGPGKVIILVETVTSNTKQIKNKIGSIIKKFGTIHMDDALKMFEHKGVVIAKKLEENQVIDDDLLMEHAILVSANDARSLILEGHKDNENDEKTETVVYEFVCEPKLLGQIVDGLKKLNCYEIEESYEIYEPKITVSLNEADAEKCQNLYNKLQNEIDDIIEIHDNQYSE